MNAKKSLEDFRKESGNSKLEFSKELGIPYTTYLRYERNLSAAPLYAVVRICEKLGIEINDIQC